MSETRLTIIGLGVIGGSLARALGAAARYRIVAWTESAGDRDAATRAGVAVAGSLHEALAGARAKGIVMLAVPLEHIADLASAALAAAPGALVLHAGSLQRRDALGLTRPEHVNVFGTHPIGGSHGSGFEAGRPELFRGVAVSIESRLDAAARDTAGRLWKDAGAARVDVRDADDHDALMSWVSHLPQLAATAIASALAERGIDPSLAGPGLRDTTRLAQSPLALWQAILDRAPSETLSAVRAARSSLGAIERALDSGDRDLLARRWDKGREWRDAAEPE